MLKRLLGQLPLVTRIRGAWQRDADVALKPLRKEIRRLSREVEALHAELRETSILAARGDRYASQLRLREELNAEKAAGGDAAAGTETPEAAAPEAPAAEAADQPV